MVDTKPNGVYNSITIAKIRKISHPCHTWENMTHILGYIGGEGADGVVQFTIAFMQTSETRILHVIMFLGNFISDIAREVFEPGAHFIHNIGCD